MKEWKGGCPLDRSRWKFAFFRNMTRRPWMPYWTMTTVQYWYLDPHRWRRRTSYSRYERNCTVSFSGLNLGSPQCYLSEIFGVFNFYPSIYSRMWRRLDFRIRELLFIRARNGDCRPNVAFSRRKKPTKFYTGGFKKASTRMEAFPSLNTSS